MPKNKKNQTTSINDPKLVLQITTEEPDYFPVNICCKTKESAQILKAIMLFCPIDDIADDTSEHTCVDATSANVRQIVDQILAALNDVDISAI